MITIKIGNKELTFENIEKMAEYMEAKSAKTAERKAQKTQRDAGRVRRSGRIPTSSLLAACLKGE